MAIIPIPALTDNYIWAIINESRHSMICVDPGDANPVLAYAHKNNLTLTYILVTHHHYDHAGGLQNLKNAFPDVGIFGPKDSRIPLINSIVRDEDVIHIDQFDFRVLSIPGHTSTHIAYLEPSKGWLFCGDTLFSAGCGRVFDGTMKKLFHSLEVLKSLPDSTLVYCAHEYTRNNLKFAAHIEPDNETIQDYAKHLSSQPGACSLPSKLALEKQINPFLRTDSATIKQYGFKKGIDGDSEFELFTLLREEKDKF